MSKRKEVQPDDQTHCTSSMCIILFTKSLLLLMLMMLQLPLTLLQLLKLQLLLIIRAVTIDALINALMH